MVNYCHLLESMQLKKNFEFLDVLTLQWFSKFVSCFFLNWSWHGKKWRKLYEIWFKKNPFVCLNDQYVSAAFSDESSSYCRWPRTFSSWFFLHYTRTLHCKFDAETNRMQKRFIFVCFRSAAIYNIEWLFLIRFFFSHKTLPLARWLGIKNSVKNSAPFFL